MVKLAEVLEDLRAESEALDAAVRDLSEVDWSRPTPAIGWTIAHQISHLAWTDAISVTAATDQQAFYAALGAMQDDPAHAVNRAAAEGLAPPAELLARWRDGRARLADTLRQVPDGTKIPWFGTSMSPVSMATARLMETWAHSQDVAETLDSEPARALRQPTARLRHIAHLGYRTIGWGFAAHGREAPTEPIRVELSGPDGALWTYGPEGAANLVTGPALDFCLAVTQRRHRSDLALVAIGPVANEWLDVAQAFAGPPGDKREPAGAGR
jgi:uncharacterized protein (TIGR03084 family)